MEKIIQQIAAGLINTSILEWVGVISGILYLLFIAKKKVIGWLFAIISSIIYTYLTFKTAIYNETFLQFFYIIMGVYGWVLWKKEENEQYFIVRWSIKRHGMIILISSIASLGIAFIIDRYTDDPYPYLDSFTMVFSLVTTFMDAKRILNSWIYWIIIDTGLIFLYSFRGFYMTGILYLLYTIIAIFAYAEWYKFYKKQFSSSN